MHSLKLAKKTKLTTKDAASAAGVANSTLRRWILIGDLPDTQRTLGRQRIFTAQQVRQIRRWAEGEPVEFREEDGWVFSRQLEIDSLELKRATVETD